MKHNIKTKEIFLTPAISDYVEKKLAHLDKFISPVDLEKTICYVEIGKTTNHHKKGDYFLAELTVHIGGKSLRAEIEKDDLYAAMDMAVDEMANELKRYEKRKSVLVKRGGAKIKALIKRIYSQE
jgi:putative sigma-54 modulation protein